MIRDDYRGLKVWITGASSGIGRAVAAEIAARGGLVVASARTRSALESLQAACAPGTVDILPFDAADREANLEAAREIEKRYGHIDIAFFNAGTCEYVDIRNFDSSMFERLVRTNFLSMVYGIEAALPLLRRSSRPQLVGMSSTVAWRGLPRAAAYASTKAAIRNMLQGLRIDLLKENIPVSIVCPGFVRTPLTDRNDFSMPGRIEPEEAGRRIADGIIRKEMEISFPRRFSIPFRLFTALPDALYTRLAGRLTA